MQIVFCKFRFCICCFGAVFLVDCSIRIVVKCSLIINNRSFSIDFITVTLSFCSHFCEYYVESSQFPRSVHYRRIQKFKRTSDGCHGLVDDTRLDMILSAIIRIITTGGGIIIGLIQGNGGGKCTYRDVVVCLKSYCLI